VNSISIENFFPATQLPLPGWVRGILLAMSDASNSQMQHDADQRDVAAVRGGDGEAYRRIVRRHQPTIARRMARFSRDRATVEELVHDCFVEAYLSLRSYRGDAPLEHWLTKIATRTGYRHWKTERRDRKRILDLQSNHSSARMAAPPAEDTAELAMYLLDQLSPRDRLAITLLHLEGRSVAEAAELAGWSQTLLKVQAYRARKKLRALLERQGIDHE